MAKATNASNRSFDGAMHRLPVRLELRSGMSETLAPATAVIVIAAGVLAGAIAGLRWELVAIGIVAALSLWFPLKFPGVFVGTLVAALMLAPVTAGLQVAPELPVVFVWRPLIAIGICSALILRLRHRSIATPRNPLLGLIFVVILGNALSIPMSVDLRTSSFRLLSLVFEWFGVALIAWEHLATARDCARLLTWFWVVLAAVCVLGAAEATTGFNLNQLLATGYTPNRLFYEPLLRGGLLRVRSTFDHPIDYASFLGFTLPPLTLIVLHAKAARQILLYGALLILVLVNEALALSAGPIIGASVGLAIVFVVSRRRILLLFSALLGLTALAFFIQGPAAGPIGELFLSRLDPMSHPDSGLAGRIATVLAALQEFTQHPFFGTGLGTWYLVNPYAVFAGHANSEGGAGNENYYAQILVESGAIGLGLTVVLFISTLRLFWNLSRATHQGRIFDLCVGTFAGLVVYFIANGTASVFISLQGPAMVWIFVTTVTKLALINRPESVPESGDRSASVASTT